jgi:hypothetical protein
MHVCSQIYTKMLQTMLQAEEGQEGQEGQEVGQEDGQDKVKDETQDDETHENKFQVSLIVIGPFVCVYVSAYV